VECLSNTEPSQDKGGCRRQRVFWSASRAQGLVSAVPLDQKHETRKLAAGSKLNPLAVVLACKSLGAPWQHPWNL
jgi:biotin-(acetyl-CoA carboxylase) ligase